MSRMIMWRFLRHKHRNPRTKVQQNARRQALFAVAGLSFAVLSGCGLKVGNNPYISQNNVGPHSQRHQPPQPSPQQAASRKSSGSPQIHANAQTQVRRKAPTKNSQIVSMARRQIGTPYRYGRASPGKGFDCSGLIFWVYKQNGLSVPRVARDQAAFGRPINKKRLQPGDIVAFRIKSGYHTGIYSGNGKFIHSPKRGSRVREESMQSSYWQRSFTGARRFL